MFQATISLGDLLSVVLVGAALWWTARTVADGVRRYIARMDLADQRRDRHEQIVTGLVRDVQRLIETLE